MISRRGFLGGLSGTAGAGLLGVRAAPVAAEPPPETSKLRLFSSPSLCQAPIVIAEDLLRAEGFTDVRYVIADMPGSPSLGLESSRRIAAGDIDFGLNFSAPLAISLDAGVRSVVLAGIHGGCLEIVGTERVRTLRDLRGRSIAIHARGAITHVFVAAMLAHVGLDHERDVRWVVQPFPTHLDLFVRGKIDAFIAFPPVAQELRTRKTGRVVVSTTTDRPWSQYFCCMLEGNADFVRRHPAATKRVVRALLKATTLCSTDPERVARRLVEGQTTQYAHAVQALTELPYGEWRSYDPEDSLRFYALRLHEARMIKSSPQKLIADGTDWRFLNELRKELRS